MSRVLDVLAVLEAVAPARFAFDFDRVGLQVGDPDQLVTKGLISLDWSVAAIESAISSGCQILLTHHPILFRPIGEVTTASYEGRAILRLAQASLSYIAAHTNWDSARGGVNDALVTQLGLTSIVEFGDAGLEQPAGRLGETQSQTLSEFAKFVTRALSTKVEAWGDPARPIRRVAVVGGAAGSEWRSAQAAGADVFITGEIKQNVAVEASDSGIAMIAAGHYATEQPGVEALASALSERLPEIEWRVFTPGQGFGGRPCIW